MCRRSSEEGGCARVISGCCFPRRRQSAAAAASPAAAPQQSRESMHSPLPFLLLVLRFVCSSAAAVLCLTLVRERVDRTLKGDSQSGDSGRRDAASTLVCANLNSDQGLASTRLLHHACTSEYLWLCFPSCPLFVSHGKELSAGMPALVGEWDLLPLTRVRPTRDPSVLRRRGSSSPIPCGRESFLPLHLFFFFFLPPSGGGRV